MANGQNQLEFSTFQLKASMEQHKRSSIYYKWFPTFKQALTFLDRMGHKRFVSCTIGSYRFYTFNGLSWR